MKKIFHQFPDGTIEVCRQFSRIECPLESVPGAKHFESSTKATKETFKKLNKRNSIFLARNSENYEDQMRAIAGRSREAIEALNSNVNASPLALVSARLKNPFALGYLINLELHPNYPIWALTGYGLRIMIENNVLDTRIFDSDDFSDRQFYPIQTFYGDGKPVWAERILSNSINLVSKNLVHKMILQNSVKITE